ncbi:hypothetical protein K430107D3_38260 [Dysosmobacter welbionis]
MSRSFLFPSGRPPWGVVWAGTPLKANVRRTLKRMRRIYFVLLTPRQTAPGPAGRPPFPGALQR